LSNEVLFPEHLIADFAEVSDLVVVNADEDDAVLTQ
jgi:hypothetical protein